MDSVIVCDIHLKHASILNYSPKLEINMHHLHGAMQYRQATCNVNVPKIFLFFSLNLAHVNVPGS